MVLKQCLDEVDSTSLYDYSTKKQPETCMVALF